MRDAKKHQHLQSREIGILHLEKKEKKKKSCRFGERIYVLRRRFGCGPRTYVWPTTCPRSRWDLGPPLFARSSPNRYAWWRQLRWHPPTSSSIFPVSSAAAPRLSCSRRRSFFPSERERGTLSRLLPPFLLHFSTASSSLLMPPDMRDSHRLSWRL